MHSSILLEIAFKSLSFVGMQPDLLLLLSLDVNDYSWRQDQSFVMKQKLQN